MPLIFGDKEFLEHLQWGENNVHHQKTISIAVVK